MGRGELSFTVSATGIFYRWKDNKGVNTLCCLFIAQYPSDICLVAKKQKHGTRETFTCLLPVHEYNRHMNSVDKFDRLKNDWMRLFIYIVACCAINAFIIHKELGMEKLTNRDFRRAIYRAMFAPKIVTVSNSEKFVPRPLKASQQVHP